jgi:hypothetical protein
VIYAPDIVAGIGALVALLVLGGVAFTYLRCRFVRDAQRRSAASAEKPAADVKDRAEEQAKDSGNSEAKQEARAAALRAWMADAVRFDQADAECPAPPFHPTLTNCAAAGFVFFEQSSARYSAASFSDILLRRSGCEFQIYFSPLGEHYALIFTGSRVLLWVDSQPLRVPRGYFGDARLAELTDFLSKASTRTGTNFVAVVSLWIWLRRDLPYMGPGQPRRFPPPPAGFTPADCEAAGFEMQSDRHARARLDGHDYSRGIDDDVDVRFSPDLRHQAVWIDDAYGWPRGQLLAVDGEAVPLAQEPERLVPWEEPRWLDDRFVYFVVAGLVNHPMYVAKSNSDRIGNLRGLLIWDTVNRVARIERPHPTDAWTFPQIVQCDGTWRIYRDYVAQGIEQPDRVLRIPE